MHEAGKFELLNIAEVDGRWHYTFSGAGEVFSVVLTRNRFVAALADTVLIAHAQPGSKTEQLTLDL